MGKSSKQRRIGSKTWGSSRLMTLIALIARVMIQKTLKTRRTIKTKVEIKLPYKTNLISKGVTVTMKSRVEARIGDSKVYRRVSRPSIKKVTKQKA
jgi:hypothetical protein